MTSHLIYIAALALACYVNTLVNGFVFDDSAYLASDAVRKLAVGDIFCSNWLGLALYRPLTLLSLGFDFQFFGEAPWGYHLTNVLLHTVNSLLLYALARDLLGEDRAALWAALLYASHPLQTEVVAWVSARGDLLASLLSLSALLAHRRRRVLAYLLYAGACLAKETAMVLPVALFLVDSREGVAAWCKRHWGYGVALLGVLALRWLALADAPAGPVSTNFFGRSWFVAAARHGRGHSAEIFAADRCAAAFVGGLLISVDFPGGVALGLVVYRGLGMCGRVGRAALGGALALARLCQRILWRVSAAGGQLAFPRAERHGRALSALGHDSGGPDLGVGWTMLAAEESRTATPDLGGRAGRGCAGWCTRTIVRNRDWHSDARLFAAVLAHYPDNARAHDNLAFAYYQQGQYARAFHHYQRAVAIQPTRLRAHFNLGILHSAARRYEEAIASFKNALVLNPTHVETHFNLGLTYQKAGRYEEAIGHYGTVLNLAPHHLKTHYNLGRAYERVGRLEDAIRQYTALVALNPEATKAYYRLGELYRRQQRREEMAAAWTTLLRLDPAHREAERIRQALTEK